MKTKKVYVVRISFDSFQKIVEATSKAEAKKIIIDRLIKKGVKRLIDNQNSSVDTY